jgi:xanthine dehydrogenase YagT iron-sulfur-binding subunit
MISSANNALGFSRRNFLTTTVASTMSVTLLDRARGETASATGASADPVAPPNLKLRINGREHRLTLDGRTTLLDAQREQCRSDGNQKGLRSRTVRRLHRICR